MTRFSSDHVRDSFCSKREQKIDIPFQTLFPSDTDSALMDTLDMLHTIHYTNFTTCQGGLRVECRNRTSAHIHDSLGLPDGWHYDWDQTPRTRHVPLPIRQKYDQLAQQLLYRKRAHSCCRHNAWKCLRRVPQRTQHHSTTCFFHEASLGGRHHPVSE